MWSVGGMTVTEENWDTGIETYPSATSSTTNVTWTDLGSKPGPTIWAIPRSSSSHTGCSGI